ncbi:MAG: NifU family protein [Promethearchaeota archaeon]
MIPVSLESKVKEVIEKIRPMLQQDGGDVEFVEVTADGVVKVRLQGHCRGCAYSQMTIKNGIQRILKQEVPEVALVEAVP